MKTLLSDFQRFALLLLISLLIALLDFKNIFLIPKGLLQVVSVPIQYGLYKTSLLVTKQFEFIVNSRMAAKERQALQEQLAQILSENANLRRKLAETQALRTQAEVLSPQTYNTVAARPVGFSRYLKIDKGSDHKIKAGQPVVYKDNLIGEVRSVTPKQSEVQLITDPDSKVAAFISSDQGKAKGILNGQFGAEMIMDKILHGESVADKDLVYSEGSESKFPRGLILGQVIRVEDRQNEVFKQAIVKPVFVVGDLDLVFVIVE
ncbi:hypothetical protein A2631_05660 [Candidatus Daviesbacteria bacterium RIFCSPHIGHO2_01_FULL_44_29]|uniref:Cell shape-determining protein MreC n=1 Tax=Candidatus Daviesbacteria bacterium RIFCSPHIGHO2_02_FULL_43_12 TaxID=1797776 RepID=A0A1F5KJ66_9BACT|nr:MAG: hypothetical protein A2631_05660 [Candidatus Daviesbacteria bacterium RIFCSPHIGHO2_01_FULL_44_29]OGE40661.1 MAG: hypothetical protein A3D25_05895 [Candidatus Daviesbacteria bacterium RIFCSPHIGHO2_02_FULL_43_12]OGE69843.1 MAG: hypothetical protein A3B55_05535 [Candidatus Daviesbacteria bacterium RIFCSPLOWO2_01_FULL_43_15]